MESPKPDEIEEGRPGSACMDPKPREAGDDGVGGRDTFQGSRPIVAGDRKVEGSGESGGDGRDETVADHAIERGLADIGGGDQVHHPSVATHEGRREGVARIGDKG
ncbi:MAG: hypothetical protein MUP36_03660 [Demequinaceae bacterium]|nr:hypothetical protein [Demequinaceae bacterium]